MASESTELVLNALGYQGGTIHQASEETGLTVQEILNLGFTEPQVGLGSDQSKGFSSVLTNSVSFNKEKVFPLFRGNISFWFGASRAAKYNKTK